MNLNNIGVSLLVGTLLLCFVLGRPSSKEDHRNRILFGEVVGVEQQRRFGKFTDVLKLSKLLSSSKDVPKDDSFNIIRRALDSELIKSILQKASNLRLQKLTNDTPKLQGEFVDLPNSIEKLSEEVKENELGVKLCPKQVKAKGKEKFLLQTENNYARSQTYVKSLGRVLKKMMKGFSASKEWNEELLFDEESFSSSMWRTVKHLFAREDKKKERTKMEKLKEQRKPKVQPSPELVSSITKLLNDTFSDLEDDYLRHIRYIRTKEA